MVTNNNEKMQELTVEEKLQNLYELQRIVRSNKDDTGKKIYYNGKADKTAAP